MSAPKVLLVYPGNQAWGFTYPMGLLYVAQSLQKDGIEVSLLHLGTGSLADLKHDDYLFVGVTMMVGDMISRGLEVIEQLKARAPGIPVVMGGVYPSIMPEQVLAHPLVDIVVIGEGELTVRELAAALLGKTGLAGIKGLAYKENGKVLINQPRELLDMETLDFDLPYGLLGGIFSKSIVVPIHTSRGCPYRCGFCYSPLFNKRKYRAKSAKKVADEIEFIIKKYNIRNFNFDYEDEFLVNPDRAVEIFETVLARGLKIKWTAFCRFDSFCQAYAKYGERFIELLKATGCFYLSFGAESGSQRLLDEVVKKDIKIEQAVFTAETLKRHKIIHRVSFINCFPRETVEDMEQTFALIDNLSRDNRYLVLGMFNLIPLPKTSIMEMLQTEFGYKPPERMEDWADYIPMRQERVTWHTKEYAAYCFDVARLCPVAFHQDFDSYRSYKDYMGTSSGAYPAGYPAYLVTRIQRYRYKRRLFAHNYEMRFFIFALRQYSIARNFLVNQVLKKYLPGPLFSAIKSVFGKKDWEGAQ